MFATRRTLLRTLERERAAFADERRQLVDTICHLAGKPWTLPPREVKPVEPDPDSGRYIVSPAQLPDE